VAEFNLKMIKIFFMVVIAMLVLVMTSGIKIVKNNQINQKMVDMEISYAKYKLELAFNKKNNLDFIAGSIDPTLAASESPSSLSIPVLLYHGIIEDPNWQPDDTNISLKDFKEQMLALKAAGYHTISLEDFSSFLHGEKKLPPKSFLLTFDDGRKDSYYPADPLLRALDFSAVMFVITSRSLGSTKDNFYLDSSEIARMAKSGRWEIESHGKFDHDWYNIDADGTKGHFLSNRLWLAGENRLETEDEYKKRVTNDLAESKKETEAVTGKKVIGFAYPFNDFGQGTENYPDAEKFIKATVESIYPKAFFQIWSETFMQNYPGKDKFMVNRIDVNSKLKTSELLSTLDGDKDKTLPYIDDLSQNNGWMTAWGDTMFKTNEGMQLRNEINSESGNMTFLEGTYLWENYSVKTNFKAVGDYNLSILVGIQDSEDYLACDYRSDKVAIIAVNNGQERIVAEKPGNFLADQLIPAAVTNKGGQIECSLGSNSILSVQADPRFIHGGIGVKTWSGNDLDGYLLINRIEVNPIQ